MSVQPNDTENLGYTVSMFFALKDVLPAALKARKMTRQAQAAHVCEQYRKHAAKVVHKEALSHTRPLSFVKRTLTIEVENPAWAQAVIAAAGLLKNALNKGLHAMSVSTIKTRVARHKAPDQPE